MGPLDKTSLNQKFSNVPVRRTGATENHQKHTEIFQFLKILEMTKISRHSEDIFQEEKGKISLSKGQA